MTGTTSSSAATGVPVVDAFQPDDRSQGAYCAGRADCSDASVTVLDAAKAVVLGSSFLGGRSHDIGNAIALHGEDACVAGTTWSTDFPTTTGATQAGAPGGNCGFHRDWLEFRPCMDGFVARVGAGTPPAPPSPTPTPSPTVTPEPAASATPSPTATAAPDGTLPGGGTTLPGSSGGATAPRPVQASPRPSARRIAARWRAGAVRGRLSGEARCIRRATVVLERRGARGWRVIARGRTRADGRFVLQARRRGGRHRLRAPELRRTTAAGTAVTCRRTSHAVG